MIQFLNEKMFFGPPKRQPPQTAEATTCDHLGTRRVFSLEGGWKCAACGQQIIEPKNRHHQTSN